MIHTWYTGTFSAGNVTQVAVSGGRRAYKAPPPITPPITCATSKAPARNTDSLPHRNAARRTVGLKYAPDMWSKVWNVEHRVINH